jgi:hypothetical protein
VPGCIVQDVAPWSVGGSFLVGYASLGGLACVTGDRDYGSRGWIGSDGAVSKAEQRAREVIAEYDRRRAKAAEHGQTLQVPAAVKRARATISAADRGRTRTPSTPQHENRRRQFEDGRIDEVIWNTTHDPLTLDSGEW